MPFGDDVVQSLLDATLPLMQAPPVNLGVICRWLGIEVYAQPCRAFGALFLLREGRASCWSIPPCRRGAPVSPSRTSWGICSFATTPSAVSASLGIPTRNGRRTVSRRSF